MNKKTPQVDGFLRKNKYWTDELHKLREILLTLPLNEEMKWRQPCYTSEGRNIVIIHGFKDYCALLFMNGGVLKDPKKILKAVGENSQVGRRVLFTSVAEIEKLEATLKAYILEAIEAEKAGLKVKKKSTEEYDVPEEFQAKLDGSAKLAKAFKALTPGRQRRYLMYFADAKQSKTREARVEKCLPMILAGKGMDDH